MKKKKILFINGHLHYGGGEKSLVNLLRNLDYEKYEIDLLLLEGKGEYYDELPEEVNVIYKNLSNTYGSFLGSIWKSIKKKDLLCIYARIIFLGRKFSNFSVLRFLRMPLLGTKNYDFAIAYRTGICTDLVHFAVRADKKALWWHHGEISMSTAEVSEFKKSLLEIKNIVAVSASCQKMLADRFPEIKDFITVIPNMVDMKSIHQRAVEFSPNFNRNYFHLVTACRFAPEKHIENIIFASAIMVKAGFKNFKWHLLGDGENLEELKNMAKNYKVSENIIFEGKKQNPYPYIKGADIYIHPSYVESQGLAILEAMALSTPCVITDNSGIRDYADDFNSIIVNQGAEFLATGILELVNDQRKFDLLKQSTTCPEGFYPQNIMTKIDHFLC